MERIVEARLRMLEHEIPDTIRDHHIVRDGGMDRGIITICDQEGQTLYVEFVESECSLSRPGALGHFNDAAGSGGKVLVIVPDEAHSAAAELLAREGNPSVELITYGVVGIYQLI
jgi:hypothetical protein